MEIERKFLIKDLHSLPFSIEAYPHRELEQAYLCTGPVVRIRKDDEQYRRTPITKPDIVIPILICSQSFLLFMDFRLNSF